MDAETSRPRWKQRQISRRRLIRGLGRAATGLALAHVRPAGLVTGTALFRDAGTQVYDVTVFGAKGDGISDDTLAIQAAIDAAEAAGGGTVFFPPGTYAIRYQIRLPSIVEGPPAIDACLTIHGSNITLQGSGRGVSIIRQMSFWSTALRCDAPKPNQTSPAGRDNRCGWQDVTWSNHVGEQPRQTIWRGDTIRITGSVAPSGQANVFIEDLEIDGTAGYTGSTARPRGSGDPTTDTAQQAGDGLDGSHAGIVLGSSHTSPPHLDNVYVRRCYIHSHRGEQIWASATNAIGYNTWIEDCELADGNGSLESCAGPLTVSRCLIHDGASDGIEAVWCENQFYRIEDCTIYNAGGACVYLEANETRQLGGGCSVERCTIGPNVEQGLVCLGVAHVRITGNSFVDAGQDPRGPYIASLSIYTNSAQSSYSECDDIVVDGNDFVCSGANVHQLLQIGYDYAGGNGQCIDCAITDNRFTVTPQALANGYSVTTPLMVYQGGVVRLVTSGNQNVGLYRPSLRRVSL